MAETTDFVSTIRVKDLISAFESKSDLVKVEFTRPRARSVGNILAKNVIVRQNEFNSLDDIEKALRKLETNLNFYEVYNKEKHVAFQEQLFNILTSIVNIEGHDDEATTRKKKLISKTQTLVSFLNQKLPSNINLANSASTNQYKYTTYATRAKENGAEDESKPSKQNYAIYSEKTKSIDLTDSGGEFFVSVKKLKENFQQRSAVTPEEPPKEEKKPIVENTVAVRSSSVVDGPDRDEPKEDSSEDETPENVSVSKLRNLFEKRSEETSKGLGIITDDKPQDNKLIFNSANINIPYTERNLGNVRLQRSVSGSYMNYVGLLKRIDMSKSTSELNKEPTEPAKVSESTVNREPKEPAEVAAKDKDSLSGDSDAESEKSLEQVERKSVQEIRKLYSNPSLVNESKQSGNKYAKENENRSNIGGFQEHKVNYSTASSGGYSTTITLNEVRQSENKYTDKKETKSNLESFKEEVNYLTANAVNEGEHSEYQNIENNRSKSNIERFKEEPINYLTANSVDEINRLENKDTDESENKSSVGFQEEDVKYLTANSVNEVNRFGNENTDENEIKSNLEGFQEEDVKYLTANSVTEDKETEIKNIEENANKSNIEGFQEEDVKYLTANSVAEVKQPEANDTEENEDKSNIEGFQEVPVSYSIAESTNEAKQAETKNSDEANEGKSNVEGFQELEVKYLTTYSDDINKETEPQEVATVEGTKHEEIIYDTAKSNTASTKEDVAVLSGAQEEDIRFSSATSNDIEDAHDKNIVNIGVEEQAVEYSTVESKNVSESSIFNTVSGNILNESLSTQSTQFDATDNVSTFPTIGSEDLDRDRSLIDEEIDKIVVEQALADEEIVVNAEDLKNADNEFEKLLESTGADKTLT